MMICGFDHYPTVLTKSHAQAVGRPESLEVEQSGLSRISKPLFQLTQPNYLAEVKQQAQRVY
jgi:hypothetical protein